MDITKPSYFGPEIGVRSQEPDRRSMVPADAMPQARSKIRLPGLYRGWMTIYLRVPVAGRRYGFCRWGLDAAGSGFYVPITLSGSAKQRGVVAQQRRHLLLDMNWGSSHIRFS